MKDQRTPAIEPGRCFMNAATASGMTVAAAPPVWARTVRAAPSHGGHVTFGLDGGASVDTLDPIKPIGTDHVTMAVLRCSRNSSETDCHTSPVSGNAMTFMAFASSAPGIVSPVASG